MSNDEHGRAARGRLTLQVLTRLVDAGEVDTIVAAVPDMYGRLMGKRFTAGHSSSTTSPVTAWRRATTCSAATSRWSPSQATS